ncbi:MAG: restriction endonuclease [Bdellovibrionales bacterium]|nr:restriction endonuclease [Bdellovibrionales bacterium]
MNTTPYISLNIPNKNQGKFKFKERSRQSEFGKSFPTLKAKFNKKVYLEWQISYDVYQKDIEKNKKQTLLYQKSFQFIGANNKKNILMSFPSISINLLKKNLFY